MTEDTLEAQAQPLPERDAIEVPIETIPLPPAHLVDELDNSRQAVEEAEPPREVATLDFVGDVKPVRAFPLQFPFRLDGRVVDAVEVRCLTTAEMGMVMREIVARGPIDTYEIYARMTGLPAPVLRALPAPDGDPITGAAWDFLPPLLRMDGG